MEEYDIIVIGAGSGLEIASAYAHRDYKVAVVEPGPLGGTCLNRGCIPSKMLIHHADVLEQVENTDRFNIEAEVKAVDYPAIVKEVNEKVSSEAEKIEEGLEASENHTLYRAEAQFVDEKVLDVAGERITADKIFVAAGTRPMVPPIPGIEDVEYMTSKDALELKRKPEDMIIIGGGYISAEMAHFFGALGVEVTILEMGDRLLGREDREISEKFTELFSKKYDVNIGLKASEVEEAGDKIRVKAEDRDGNTHSFAAEKLMVAAGRIPNTDKLRVDNAAIETDEMGFIETDEFMMTSTDEVYAIGDIAGNYMFKHSANLEAEQAFKNSISQENSVDYTAMPHAVFSSPRVAGVGKTEQELEEEGVEYVKSRYDYADTAMGLAMKEEDGFVKVLIDPENKKILGCHIIGPEAPTLIHEVLVAMKAGNGTIYDIQDTVHIHPALNEVVQRAFNRL